MQVNGQPDAGESRVVGLCQAWALYGPLLLGRDQGQCGWGRGGIPLAAPQVRLLTKLTPAPEPTWLGRG